MTSTADVEDVRKLAGHRVLVVGDLVLDEYVTGRMTRISREAPVPIVEVVHDEDRAGSAASPAANIIALGSYATVIGAVGCDPSGTRLESRLRQLGVDSSALVQLPELSTSTKTRILAEGYTGGLHGRQQVMRLDRTAALSESAARLCAEQVERLAANFDAVLLSDYRGGVVSQASIQAARASGRPIAVDSQGDLRRFRSIDLVKVNLAEAQAALGSADVRAGGDALRRELQARVLVITLGAEGMLVFAGQAQPAHVPAVGASQVFDVTGAGDTVIAVLTLGMIAGLSPRRSAELASAAASVVVRRLGVAVATPDEIVDALRDA
ncbi:MAG TPA: PfkB family carbohydrate kinase [Chloroflexota bacterium]